MSLPADAEEEETEFALQPYHGKTREQIAAELNALERLQQAQAELAKRLAKEQAADAHWLGISFGKMQFSLTGLLLATFVMGLGIVITRLLISNLSLQVVSYLLLMGIALCAAALRERESAFLLSLMQVLLFAYALSLLCGWALM
jgi:K+-sensing histidine kinase KdpD